MVSQGEHALVGAELPGVHLPLSSADASERVASVGRREGCVAIVATDDATVETASAAASALGLPGNPVGAVRCSRRKDLGRAALAAAGLPVPRFRVLELERPIGPQLRGIDYPCVVKPVALSGSRGVIRADGESALLAACQRVARILEEVVDPQERSRILVEGFIPGPEVALEGLLDQGRLQVLALFDKPDPLDGPYFEETYYLTPSRLPAALRDRVIARVRDACAAYGLVQGPVHAEVRLSAGEAWVLEVASRTIGGQCARLLRFGTGYGLEDLVLGQAAGIQRDLTPPDEAGGVLMIPTPRAGVLRRVEGALAAQRIPYVEDVEICVREGYRLVPLPEGSSYLGFVFARAPTPERVEAALRAAHACLSIVTAPLLATATA